MASTDTDDLRQIRPDTSDWNQLQSLRIFNKSLPDNKKSINKFIHEVIDSVCCGYVHHTLDKTSDTITKSDSYALHSAITCMCALPQQYDFRNKDSWVHQLCQYDIEADVIEAIANCLLMRTRDIRRHQDRLTQSISGAAILEDFDWQLRYCVSSDSLSKLNECLATLSLTLATNEPTAPARQCKSIEMNGVELEKLIHSLEDINQALVKFQT